MKEEKVTIVRERLVALTGDFTDAVILGQLIHWHNNEECLTDMDGWFSKSAVEISHETMLDLSTTRVLARLTHLVDRGFVERRHSPHYKWDRTIQYRIRFDSINFNLGSLGYEKIEGISYTELSGVLA